MKKIIYGLIIIILAVSPVLAKTGLDLETAGIGARPLGMGKAYLGVSDDTNTLFLNPAGLTDQAGWSMTSMSTRLMNRVDYKLLGSVFTTDLGNIGVGYVVLSSPAGYSTGTDEASLVGASKISYQSSKAVIAYGHETAIQNLSFGLDLNFLNQGFSGYSGSSYGYSVGASLLYKLEENVSLGANLRNLTSQINWDTGTKENLPLSLKLGGAVRTFEDKILTALDADISSQGPLCLHGGVELKSSDNLTFRVGVDQDPVSGSQTTTNVTGGIGLNISGIKVDFAYHLDNNISENASYYLSISIAEPEAYQPKFSGSKSEEIALSPGTIVPSADLL